MKKRFKTRTTERANNGLTSKKRPGISTGALPHIAGKQNGLKLAP